MRPLTGTCTNICVIRRQDHREWSGGLEGAESCNGPSVQNSSPAIEWELVGIRENKPVSVIETGKCFLRSHISDVLRDVRLCECRSNIRGVVARFRPRVIRIEGQAATHSFLDFESGRVINGISVPSDQLETAQQRI